MDSKEKINYEIQELAELKSKIYKLRKIFDKLNEEELKNELKNIIQISDKIFQELLIDSSKIDKIRKFNNYYLQTLEKILLKYIKIKENNIKTKDSEKFLKNVKEIIKKVTKKFEEIYNSLYEDEILDIDAEIEVLKKEFRI